MQQQIEEVKRAYDELGAKALKVASNSNGVYLGDPMMDPVFGEINKRKGIVIIHLSRPQQVPENVFTQGPAPIIARKKAAIEDHLEEPGHAGM